MNLVKKLLLRALRPDFVFENRRGERIIINSKTTIGQLTAMGGRVELTPMGKPIPPFAYAYIGETRKVGEQGIKITPSEAGTCFDVFPEPDTEAAGEEDVGD